MAPPSNIIDGGATPRVPLRLPENSREATDASTI